jgi:MFS family permease
VTRPAAHRPARARTFASLRDHRDFRFLWVGDVFANLSQWLEFITVGWLALAVSGSATHSILTVATRAVPTLLLGPWAGVVADRWDRRRLALGIALAMAAVALAFGALLLLARERVGIWHVYAYMGLSGVGLAMNQPVRQALIANTVPAASLTNALALATMIVTFMRLAGTLIGAVLIETASFESNFFAEGGLHLAMGLSLLPMRTPYRGAAPAPQASALANLREGLAYIAGDRILLRLNLLNLIRAGAFVTLLLLLPAYAHGALGAGAWANMAMIASMGIGGSAAAVTVSSWGFFARKGAVGLITLATGSAAILVLALSRWLWLSLLMMAVVGLSQTHFIISNLTLIQTVAPDALRGRISSVWHYQQGLVAVFALLASAVTAATGVRFALLALGAVALALALLDLVRYTDIRRLD